MRVSSKEGNTAILKIQRSECVLMLILIRLILADSKQDVFVLKFEIFGDKQGNM